MIGYRHADARYPFLWEAVDQPAARWHAWGEGPAHYFASSPDGAWAEFLRHEEITDPADLETVRRALWVADLGEEAAVTPDLPEEVPRGGLESYPACQDAARELRGRGVTHLEIPSAALQAMGALGWVVDRGLKPVPQNGKVIVLFGPQPNLVGWLAAIGGPRADLLERVRYLGS